MADAAAARREARRRRILENSNNRLQLIAGKSGDESARASPVKPFFLEENSSNNTPAPELVPDSRCSSRSSVANGVPGLEAELIGLLSTFNAPIGAGDTEVDNDLAAFTAPTPEPVKNPTLWEKLVTYKYDVVILAIVLQVLYNVASVQYDNVYIFLPVVVYVLTKLLWAPEKQQSSIANALLLMNGLSPDKVQKIMFVSQLAMMVTQDISLFLFTTICIQSLYVTISDNIYS
ncbi:hypothetical protein JYU34_001743 [Plutella xylostella]|uniref:Uncharacterized protein n=2 Tax=Plutella xylostella TaxID=51655 RepID=A0ABQ7R4R3_PLUXY|nr:uncharacterized protein LOC119693502 [Plutella xylostella]KAG7312271.1 hypothetical protein JYU34_001743 [Plutella xylostella]